MLDTNQATWSQEIARSLFNQFNRQEIGTPFANQQVNATGIFAHCREAVSERAVDLDKQYIEQDMSKAAAGTAIEAVAKRRTMAAVTTTQIGAFDF